MVKWILGQMLKKMSNSMHFCREPQGKGGTIIKQVSIQVNQNNLYAIMSL
uniref:Uncharacterized protein n=1 Tax=Arundo donax TaxID=35708 RepID=A0A0A9DK33_ARUDO